MPRSLVVLLLACSAPAGAQPHPRHPAPDPDRALAQYLYETWSIEEGLPQNTVEAIVQAPSGHLWTGTEEGLARFDGHTFTVFGKQNATALEESHSIAALLKGSDGTLWVGTRSGVAVQRNGHLASHQAAVLRGMDVRDLAEGPNETLWIGTHDAGLFACRGGTCTSYDADDGLPSQLVGELHVAGDGAVWAGTDRGLAYGRSGAFTTLTTEDGLPDNFITALYPSRDGGLWVGTRGGLARWHDGRLEALPPGEGWPDEPVWAILEDAAGSLWLGLDRSGLARRVPGQQGGGLDRYGPEDGLPHGRVISLFVDREGNLWIGTEAGGLTRLRDALITTFTTAQGLPEDVVNTAYEDTQGRVWAGTDGGGLAVLNATRPQATFRTLRQFEQRVTSVQGRGEALWVGTQGGGLFRSAEGRWHRFGEADGVPSAQVYALHVGAVTGDLLVGTDRGVGRYQGGRFTALSTADGLTSDFITVLLEDRSGALWVGTYDGGLNRVEGGRVEAFEELRGDVIAALHEDADGALWVGTYGGGLLRYEDGRFFRFTPRHGLFDDKVYQILEDDQGWLWMGCNLGLFRVEKAELDAVADGRRGRLTSLAFDEDNGMKSREVNGGVQPAGWKGRDGRLWFPTMGGLSVVDPAARRYNAVPPPVTIEAVWADEEPIASPAEPAEPLVLAPGTDELEFAFAAPSLVDPPAVRYRYVLEGDDDDWRGPTDDRSARYTHLAPGQYTFRVTAMNNDGVWNEAGASFAFRIRPFFWQAAWFWALLVGTVASLGAGGYTWRVRQLTTRQRQLEEAVEARTRDLRTAKEQIEAQAGRLRDSLQEKEVLLREVHHRVKNNLQVITSLLQLQSQQVDEAETRVLFQECRSRVRSMAMIHERLYRAGDLARLDFARYIEGIAAELARSYNARRRGVELAVEAEPGPLGVDQAISCGLIVNELVSNAFKHAFPEGRRGRVTVRFRTLNGVCHLAVEDDGAGLPPTTTSPGAPR